MTPILWSITGRVCARFVVAVCVFSVGVTGTAFAAPQEEQDEPEEGTLGFSETINVSANRREQEIQDVGISVTVIGGEDLAELEVVTTTDLTQQVPNVYLQDFFGGAGLSARVHSAGALTSSTSTTWSRSSRASLPASARKSPSPAIPRP